MDRLDDAGSLIWEFVQCGSNVGIRMVRDEYAFQIFGLD